MIRCTIVIYLYMYTVQVSIYNDTLYNSDILSMYTVQFSISNDPLYNSDIFIYVHCTGFYIQ